MVLFLGLIIKLIVLLIFFVIYYLEVILRLLDCFLFCLHRLGLYLRFDLQLRLSIFRDLSYRLKES
jgi:hypothetical protein